MHSLRAFGRDTCSVVVMGKRADAPRLRRRTPPPSRIAVGRRVHELRVRAGLSQTQLARPFYTRAYISAIELHKVKPSLKALEYIARKLNTTVADLATQPSERDGNAVEAITRALNLLNEARIDARDPNQRRFVSAQRTLAALLIDIDGSRTGAGNRRQSPRKAGPKRSRRSP